jgi:lipopolysaccharide/colanic/teichoic acid biosynthesis glycosyltransferase
MMEFLLIKQPRVIPRQLLYQSAKRVLDILLCLLILPLALPIMLICALVIPLDSPGPVLFVQDRIGKGGRKFRIYKFRTLVTRLNDRQSQVYMKAYVRGDVTCLEEGQEVFKPIKPAQITRMGRLLRKTSLDELPQLINIFKGEMSIVGPRPNVPCEVEAYRPWHHERLEVLPGVTGLAQVHGRSCIDFNTLVRCDVEYIENRSIGYDLKILWWTSMAIIKAKGAL